MISICEAADLEWTHTHTHKPTTVTLAAHARRGLITRKRYSVGQAKTGSTQRFNFVLRNFIEPVTFAHCAVMSLY